MRSPTRRRAFLVLTVAGVAAGGCGEAATESVVLAGSYRLETINGQDLPATPYDADGITLTVEGGSLTFGASTATGLEQRHMRCPGCEPAVDDRSPRSYTQQFRMIAGNAVVLTQQLSDGTQIADTAAIDDGKLIFASRWMGLRVGGRTIRATAVYTK